MTNALLPDMSRLTLETDTKFYTIPHNKKHKLAVVAATAVKALKQEQSRQTKSRLDQQLYNAWDAAEVEKTESGPDAVASQIKWRALGVAKDKPQARAVFFGLVAGLAPAIACLYVYFHHGGATAECSHPLPLWLKVNGFSLLALWLLSLLANCLLPILLNGERWAEGKSDGNPTLMCTACLLNTFLLGWFITGLVWLTSTDKQNCDHAIFDGTKSYFVAIGILMGVVSLLLCFEAVFDTKQPKPDAKAMPRAQTERSSAV